MYFNLFLPIIAIWVKDINMLPIFVKGEKYIAFYFNLLYNKMVYGVLPLCSRVDQYHLIHCESENEKSRKLD